MGATGWDWSLAAACASIGAQAAMALRYFCAGHFGLRIAEGDIYPYLLCGLLALCAAAQCANSPQGGKLRALCAVAQIPLLPLTCLLCLRQPVAGLIAVPACALSFFRLSAGFFRWRRHVVRAVCVLVLVPTAIVAVFGVILADFGSVEEIIADVSPSGRYEARIRTADEGALGGSQRVIVVDRHRTQAVRWLGMEAAIPAAPDFAWNGVQTVEFASEHEIAINGEIYPTHTIQNLQ